MNLERRIIAGLIVSVDYLRSVAPLWTDELVESPEMRRIARWCLDFYARYRRAPDRDIEAIYFDALRDEAIPKAEAELIEGIFTAVSDDYGRGEQFNAAYLFDQTVRFFRDRDVAEHNERVAMLRETGQLEEAEALAAAFRPRSWLTSRGLDLGTEPGYERLRAVFDQISEPILSYPGALGEMLNSHLIRDGFVAFLAPEKRGKTWLLIDLAFRALRRRCHVAFFQAGDLSEPQMLRRIAIHLSRRSDNPRYTEAHWRPVGDCARNQFNLCHRPDRNCDHGVYAESDYPSYNENPVLYQIFDKLSEVADRNPDYAPCDSAGCRERRPCVWLLREPAKPTLTGAYAERVTRSFFARYRRRFRLATYPSGMLSCDEIRSCLDEWERQDDFVADVIAIDYADLMTAATPEYRHRQDEIWKGLRAISQERRALLVTATQADADSYKAGLLRMSNFAEDKRKYGHVTAMWGLNQDPQGHDKELGVLRVNTIVAREGMYSPAVVVHVLQDLAAGRSFVESF